MFVGESGVARIIERSCQLMRDHKTDDIRKLGGIDLPTIQKYLNFHFSVTSDLYGTEISSNAAGAYTTGLKGRFGETRIEDDHNLEHATYPVLHWTDGHFRMIDVAALNTLNERLRRDWIDDVAKGVARWNKVIQRYGIDFHMKVPHIAFHRGIGHFTGLPVTPDGKVIGQAEWDRRRDEWLPSAADRAYLAFLMSAPVHGAGQYANWIAPPARGINNKPIDFDYVRFA